MAPLHKIDLSIFLIWFFQTQLALEFHINCHFALHYVVKHDQYLQFVIVVTLVLANLDVAFTCMSSSDFEQANSQGTSS